MKKCFATFLATFITIWIVLMGIVAVVDPMFHYHAPLKRLYYKLDDPRYQNRGIAATFEYDAILTGTSLTQNFSTSEFDALFGTNAIKIHYSGATFYETAETLKCGFNNGKEIKYVLRSLDVNHLMDDETRMREDLGEYPYYLYDDNLWNDYKYVCNEDILFKYCLPALASLFDSREGGHTSFDEYMLTCFPSKDWQNAPGTFDWNSVTEVPFSDEDKQQIIRNVDRNIIQLAKEHPETTFIYYIPPYNVAWWMGYIQEGKFDFICKNIETAVKLMLECDNIRIYEYTDKTELTTDLSYYSDSYHYVNEVNSWILNWISSGEGLITKENVDEYLSGMHEYYRNYEYCSAYDSDD